MKKIVIRTLTSLPIVYFYYLTYQYGDLFDFLYVILIQVLVYYAFYRTPNKIKEERSYQDYIINGNNLLIFFYYLILFPYFNKRINLYFNPSNNNYSEHWIYEFFESLHSHLGFFVGCFVCLFMLAYYPFIRYFINLKNKVYNSLLLSLFMLLILFNTHIFYLIPSISRQVYVSFLIGDNFKSKYDLFCTKVGKNELIFYASQNKWNIRLFSPSTYVTSIPFATQFEVMVFEKNEQGIYIEPKWGYDESPIVSRSFMYLNSLFIW